MTKFRINDFHPTVEEKYYTRLKEYLERALSTYLRPKAEYGSTRSEFGYQLIASSTCRKIANVFGLNEDKVEMLSMAVGICFPYYGQEGLKVVKQYIIDHNLDIQDLEVDAIAFHIQENLYGLSKGAYQLIHDYYKHLDSCLEIKIVRLVQETIIDIKKTEKFYNGYPGDLLYNVTHELVELANTNQKLMKSNILKEYEDKIKNEQLPSIDETTKQKIVQEINKYIHDFTSFTGDLTKFNKTKEEALLIYVI